MSATAPPSIALSAEDQRRLVEVDELAARGAAGVPPLVDALSDRSWAVRRGVVAALARIGDPAVGPLTDVMGPSIDNLVTHITQSKLPGGR